MADCWRGLYCIHSPQKSQIFCKMSLLLHTNEECCMKRKYFCISAVCIHEFQGVPWLSDITLFVRYFAPHTLCNCEAVVHLRFCHLGQDLMELGDYLDAPLSEVSCWRAEQKGMHSRLLDGQDAWASVAHPWFTPPVIYADVTWTRKDSLSQKLANMKSLQKQLLVPENCAMTFM
jgi:hypothetical protein